MADAFSGYEDVTIPQDKYKDSLIEDVKASAVLTINGLFDFKGGKYASTHNNVDDNFNHLATETQELYKQYNIDPIKQTDFYDSRNKENLLYRLERHRARQEAKQRLDENLPIMQYPLMMSTSLFDPVSLAAAPLGYKVVQGIGALKEATRFNNVVKSALVANAAAVPSEYLLQASADDVNGEELAYIAGFASLLGGGIGSLLPTNTLVDTNKVIDDMLRPPTEDDIIRRQADILGVNDFDHIKQGFEGKIEGLKKHFIWSPIGNMMKSQNPIVRAVGNVLEKSPVALTNGDEIVTSSAKTAMSTKGELNGRYFKLMQEMDIAYKQRLQTNPNLSRAEYQQELGRRYRTWLKEVEEEAMDRYDDLLAVEGGREALYRQATGNQDVIAEELDKVVIDQLKREVAETKELASDLKGIQKYFDDIQQFGESIGHGAFKGKSGKTYLNRVFNKDAIEIMGTDVAVAKLHQALKANPITRRQINNMIAEGRTAQEIDNDLLEYSKDVIFKIQKSSVYEEMDFNRVNADGVPSPLKNRILQIDEEIADDLLVNDIGQLTEYYNYKTSGKLALKKHLGIENYDDIKSYQDKIQAKGRELGMSAKDIAKDLDMFTMMIDSVNGTREIAKRPNTWGQKSARMFTKFNYVTLGGTFGLNTVGELGAVISANGIKAVKYLVPAIKETINMYRSKPTKELTNELLALGIGEQIYRSNRVMRYDSIDTFNTTGKFETLLDKGGNLMSNASGLNFATTTLELMAGASTIEDLMRMAAKPSLTRAEQKRLARLGLSVDDIRGIQQHSRAEYENGYLMAYNFNDWTDQALVDKIKDAISEVVKNSVLQADPTTIPAWAINPDNPMLKIATQFMRFPLVAHERLFIKGIDEMSTRQAVGFMSSLGLMTSIYALREEAMIQAGIIDEADRKYDWNTDEGIKNLAIAGINKTGHLGVTATAFDYMNKAFNPDADTYGTDTTTTVLGTFGRLNQATDVIKDIADGNFSDRTQRTINYMMPYYTLPYIKAGVDALQKD